MNITNGLIGERVRIPAYTDAWMRGKRFGEIAKVYRKKDGLEYIVVTLDMGGKVVCLLDDCRLYGHA